MSPLHLRRHFGDVVRERWTMAHVRFALVGFGAWYGWHGNRLLVEHGPDARLLAGCTDSYGRVDYGRTALLGVGVVASMAIVPV